MRRHVVTFLVLLLLGVVSAWSAEPAALSPEFALGSSDWLLRVEEWSYHETSRRVEVRSGGAIASSKRFRRQTWEELHTDRLTAEHSRSVYEAANALFKVFRPANRSHLGVRDVDSGYEITLATPRGSFQIWFVSSELAKDREMSQALVRLVEAVDQRLPKPARLGRPWMPTE